MMVYWVATIDICHPNKQILQKKILAMFIHAWIIIKYTVTTIITLRTETITIQIFNYYGTSEAPLHYFPIWDCQILLFHQLFDRPRPRRIFIIMSIGVDLESEEGLSVKTLIDTKHIYYICYKKQLKKNRHYFPYRRFRWTSFLCFFVSLFAGIVYVIRVSES